MRNFNSENARRFNSLRPNNRNQRNHYNQFEKDPMQLEFILKRLSNKQSLLAPGQLVNNAKLDLKMGEAFEQSKKYHLQLQAKHRIELERNLRNIIQQTSNRDNIRQQVLEKM